MEKCFKKTTISIKEKNELFFMIRKVCGKRILWWEGSSIMKTEFYLILEGSSGIEKFHYKKKVLLWKRAPL